MNDKNFFAHAIARQRRLSILKSQLEAEKAKVETAVKPAALLRKGENDARYPSSTRSYAATNPC
eukprot:6121445-Amphidinium_carterae.1